MSLRKIWRDFYQLWFWNVWIGVTFGKTFGYNQVCKPWLPDIFCNQTQVTVESKDNKVSADILSLCWNLTFKCKKLTGGKKKSTKNSEKYPLWPQTYENKKNFGFWDCSLEIPSWSVLHWGFLLTLADHGSLQYHTCCLSCKLVTKLFLPTHCFFFLHPGLPSQWSRIQGREVSLQKGSRLETNFF